MNCSHLALQGFRCVQPRPSTMDDGSIAAEYYRLGVLEEGAEAATGGFFRLDTSTNADYGLSSTYPATLAVPSDATPAMISAVAAFRSRGRIPALTWRDPSGAAGHLVRCAQPTRGLLGRTADIDEAYVQGSHSARTRHCISALFSLWRVHCVWCRHMSA